MTHGSCGLVQCCLLPVAVGSGQFCSLKFLRPVISSFIKSCWILEELSRKKNVNVSMLLMRV